ncbi:MAG: lamin tail domain-containing protein [Patescibacteria group bacterium]
MKKVLLFSGLIFFSAFFYTGAVSAKIQISKEESLSLLTSTKQRIANKWIDLTASGNFSKPEEQAALFLIQSSIKREQVDFVFNLSKEALSGLVKTALFLMSPETDALAIINKIEKITVNEAVEDVTDWFLQKEIKVATGNIKDSFLSYRGKLQNPIYHYNIIYKPLTEKSGEVLIEFLSQDKIEPESAGTAVISIGKPCWEFSDWRSKGNTHVEPFIIRIKGNIEQGAFGTFVWNKTIDVDISFTEEIPDYETGKSVSFFEKIKQKVKQFVMDRTGIPSKLYDFIAERLIELKDTLFTKFEKQKAEINITVLDEKKETSQEQEKLSLPETKEISVDKIIEKKKVVEEEKFESDEKNEETEKKEEEKEEVKKVEKEEIKTKDKKQEIIICQKKIGDYPLSDKVIFNEIAWMGTTTSSSDEWIELKNISGSTIDLTGWQLLDKDQNIKIFFDRSSIVSNDFYLLERTNDDSVSRITADLIYTGSLSNTSESLYLFDNNCNLQDKIEAISGWPEGENSSKRTMERKDNLAWQTSNNVGGTPKSNNSTGQTVIPSVNSGGGSSVQSSSLPSLSQPKILITEIQIEGSNDFIELYNPSNQTVDLDGYQLKKKTESGSEYSIRLFSAGIVIPSKNYLIWASSKDNYYQTIGAELYSSAYISSNNSIALFDNNKNIVDMIAWGVDHNNPFVENSVFPQNPENEQTIGRKWNSGLLSYQDTDDNGQDFELQISTPKAQNDTFRDIIAPQTFIDNNPLSLINLIEFIFIFSSDKEIFIFECKLDEQNWENCESPKIYNNLSEGEHNFLVRATDISQNIDFTPAQHQWQIDTTPPQTEILSSFPILTNQNQANFTFSSNEQSSTFECKLDEQDWENCQSPKIYENLIEGEHNFLVRATDLAGNLEILPVQYSWTIDISIENPSLSLVDLDTNSFFYTNERMVKLTITNDEEATSWLLSENEIEIENIESSWQNEKPLEFTLSEEDGQKTVYLWIKDEGENISSKISDLITLDTTSPFVQFNSLNFIQSSTDFNVSWLGEDTLSGILEYHFKFREETEAETEDWQVISNKSYQFFGQNGHSYYFKIRAKDNIGNIGDWTDEITTQILEPILQITPESLGFTATEYGGNPESLNLTVGNIGFGDLNWETNVPEVDWLNIDPISGEAPFDVSVSVDISGLEAAQFQTQIQISSNGGSKEFGIVLNLLEDTILPNSPQIISPQNNQAFNTSNITLVGKTEANALVLASLLEVRADEEGSWELEIELQEGQNSIEIKAKDEAGNESQSTTLNLILDTQLPIIVINELPEFEHSLSFFVSWSGEDVASGIDGFQFRYSEDGIDWTYWPSENEYNLETQYNFIGEDNKTYYFQVKAKDQVGNENNWQETSTIISLPFPMFSVVINEIAWMGTEANYSDEWIELYNNTNEDIDLAGWKLKSDDEDIDIEFSDVIMANSYFLLERTDNNTISDVLADLTYTGALGNDGERLELLDPYGNAIDLIDCFEGWFAGDNDINMSMERIVANASGSHDNWANNNIINQNGLDSNGYFIYGTPGQENSVSKSSTEIVGGAGDFRLSNLEEVTLTYLGSPYISNWNLIIPVGKTLRIEPGVIIKFNTSCSLIIRGTLKAIGEEANKIIFTAIGANYWETMYFEPTSVDSELSWVEVDKIAGSHMDTAYHAVFVDNSDVAISNFSLSNYYLKGIGLVNSNSLLDNINISGPGKSTNGIGVSIDGGSTTVQNSFMDQNKYGIYIESGSKPIIENNNFEYNKYPIWITNVNAALPVFVDNQGDNNDFNVISISGNITEDSVLSPSNSTLDYLVNGNLFVAEDVTFSIEPGLNLKFNSGASLLIRGTLSAIGTSEKQIIFTDYQGSSWKTVYFYPESQNSVLTYVLIEHAGCCSTDAGVFVDQSVVNFDNVYFSRNGVFGLLLDNSSSVMQNCSFEGNTVGLKIENTSSIQLDNYYFSNNKNRDIYWKTGGENCEALKSDPELSISCQ